MPGTTPVEISVSTPVLLIVASPLITMGVDTLLEFPINTVPLFIVKLVKSIIADEWDTIRPLLSTLNVGIELSPPHRAAVVTVISDKFPVLSIVASPDIAWSVAILSEFPTNIWLLVSGGTPLSDAPWTTNVCPVAALKTTVLWSDSV